MDRLILLDTAMRLLTIGQLLLISVVIGRGHAPRPIRAATVTMLVCICTYLILATPIRLTERGPFWALIQLTAQATPMMLWVFAHLLFERPLNRIAVIAGLVTLIGCWIGFGIAGPVENALGLWLGIIQRGTSLAMTAHAIVIAVSERGDDLIEKRRRLRVGFVIVVGALALMVLVIEMIFGFRHTGVLVTLPQAFAILVATMAMGAALLQSDADILFEPAATDENQPAPALTPSEQVLKQKLDAAMAQGIYREPGLSIGVLADRLGTPEHRLRALINQRLGYRNFSAFLNHHRIAEAKQMLADPAHVDLPILTIAMDLGYGSLAPFNRAFRDAEGQPPSDFRRVMFTEKS